MKRFNNLYSSMISEESLLLAWRRFRKGKTKRKDVVEFERNLDQNINSLHKELAQELYQHGRYYSFYISDPKLRHIHKATVRDRVVHHVIFQALNPIFEPTFIFNSYSCRIGKGTHKGVKALVGMIRKVSQNYTHQCFVLKCDIRKFFDSIDQDILLNILNKRIADPRVMQILKAIIFSFSSHQSNLFARKGIPIGNLVSQLFANIYMNEFDQFIKHDCGVKYYARYTDDFVVVSDKRDELVELLAKIIQFLTENLHLELHPNKLSISSLNNGIDFLGFVARPYCLLLRTKTKRRMLKKLDKLIKEYEVSGGGDQLHIMQVKASYLGHISHADAHTLSKQVRDKVAKVSLLKK
ncbi:MAG: reverse transcriptase/maturase family protein [Patescibacteria group bacterium]